jgi:HSP20 family molecular chaperone IbpA
MATKTDPPVFAPRLVMRRVVRDYDCTPADQGMSAFETLRYSLSDCPWVPDLEVFEQDDLLTIYVDLPAMKLEEVSVRVTDEYVRIEGERQRPADPARKDLHAPERIYGRFGRTVRLPENANAAAVTWVFENGVLQITLPLLKRPIRSQRGEGVYEGPAS